MLKYLQEGGRAVLLDNARLFPQLRATDEHPLLDRQTCFTTYRSAWDYGNLGTHIIDHPLTNDFPHDGYCDLQFYSLIEGAYPLVLENIPAKIEPIIRSFNTFSKPESRAYLFEARVGKGKLLVSSFVVPEGDPAAYHFYELMAKYVLGDQFNPTAKLDAEFLSNIQYPTRNIQ